MEQIRSGKIAMKPRWYFIIGSLLMVVGVATASIVSVFLISLTRFALRTHGPMGQYRLQELLSSFPLWAPLLTGVSLMGGIWLLKKFDFSYKRNFALIVVGFLFAVIMAGVTLDYLGLDEVWLRQGPMRGIMREYLEKQSAPTPGWMRGGKMRNRIK